MHMLMITEKSHIDMLVKFNTSNNQFIKKEYDVDEFKSKDEKFNT